MRGLIVTLTALVVSTAGAAVAEPVVSAAWARATPPGARTAAAYLSITNNGDADRLLRSTSSAAREIQIHTHVADDGIQRMVRLAELLVPAGGTVELVPGGLHLMLIDLVAPLTPGGEITLVLEFAAAAPLSIAVPIVDARAAPPHGGH